MRKIFPEVLSVFCAALILTGCNTATPAASPAATAIKTSSGPGETIVSLTFDDGKADNFAMASLFKENDLRGTFYIPSGLVGSPGYMTWDQLQILQADGNEIGGHTLNHEKLGGLDTETLRHQICDDRANLIEHGFMPISFAYPAGNYDEKAQQMVEECGYTSARTILGPGVIPPPDRYALGAFPYIVDDTGLGKLQAYVGGTRKTGGGWVILIFHHVCDSCDFFSVKPDVMKEFIPWLARQQSMGRVRVMTVGEVISEIVLH
jgi:peptidoglycan/xylan/chitin deacetylase (PgdA/CDA1 family)